MNRLQNYLVFIPIRRIKFIINNTGNFKLWGCIGVTRERNKNPYISDVNFAPKITAAYRINNKVEFKGICLKPGSVSLLHKKIVHLYISYELDTWSKDLNADCTLGNWLFGAVKLIKNPDPEI